jgi:peptide-methionine (S)-S-oxide reductase
MHRVLTTSLVVLTAGLFSACHAAPNGEKLPVQLDGVPSNHSVATFAGGCFWCMEAPFDKLPGVISTVSGYTDGYVDKPTYKDVSYGRTGHTEAVRIIFDPTKISFEQLLRVFWKNIDPTAKDRQFCDAGTQYRSGVYFHGEKQRQATQESIAWAQRSMKVSGPIHTEIKAATRFYPAESYHQDYYKKNPSHYRRYREGCGRDARLKTIWGPLLETQTPSK